MWDKVAQFAIPILGVSAIALVGRKNKWGFVLGIASMPFWFLTSIINHQWGVFIANIGLCH